MSRHNDEERAAAALSEQEEDAVPPPSLSPSVAPPPLPGEVVTVAVGADQDRQVDVILPAIGADLSPEISLSALVEQAVRTPGAEDEEAFALSELDETLIEAADVLEMEASPGSEAQSAAQAEAEAPAFYRREAEALTERQPERAALMRIEAAGAAERAGADVEEIHRDLDAALELLPSAGWLIARARRMLTRIGSHERAIKLGQREVKLGGDPATRAALLLESAAIVRYRLANPKAALQFLRQGLEIRTHYVPALVASSALCHQFAMYAEAAQALERLADCLTHPEQRAILLYGAAMLKELRLGEKDAAREIYKRALDADPQNMPAAHALTELYRYGEQWPELCRALEHMAGLVEDPALRGELLLEAGTLHLDRTGDLAAAARDLSRAVSVVPDNRLLLQRLAAAYQREGRMREAVETLRRLEVLVPSTEGRAALLTQIGTMLVSMNEPDRAAESFRAALELVPAYMPAVQEYGSLCRKRQDFEGFVTLGRQESESQLPAAARAVRYVELAEHLVRDLERPKEAAEAYRRAIELDPHFHFAYWSLATLLRRRGWHKELAAVLLEHAQICQDPRTRTHLLLAAARVQSGALGETDAAIETLRQAGTDAPPASVRFDLLELYTMTDRHADLVQHLLQHADQTSDAAETESCCIWAALVLERQLGEEEQALNILRNVLKSNPKSYAAIHAIGRILHSRGAWEDLVKLYHHELSTEPNRPDGAVLLCRMGRIIDERMGNAAAAISAYSKALRHDPGYTPALAPLEDLVRRQGKWANLVDVLRAYAQAAGDRTEAVSAYCRAAEVACWQLRQFDVARELYRRALEREPGSRTALMGLVQVHTREGDWPTAIQHLSRLAEELPSGEQCSLVELEVARIKEFHLGDASALELWQRAAAGPLGAQLREEVLRLRRAKGGADLSHHVAEIGQQTPDDAMAGAHLLDAVYMQEFGAEVAEDLLELVELAHERQPDVATVWALERALTRKGEWGRLAKLAENQAQLEFDRTVRTQQLAITGVAYWQAGAPEDAERVSRECLNFDAHCLPALRTLLQIAESREDWRQLAELRDRLAEASAHGGNRLEACLSAADIWMGRVGDASRALASLSVALADDPNQVEAFTRAESLLRQRGDFEEISRLYQRRIRGCADPQILVDLRWRHTQLLRYDLKRPDRAIVELNELLRTAPQHTQALSALADLHEELGHWSDAASALQAVMESSTNATLRHDARLRLANLWVERLHDPRRSREVLEAAIAESGQDIEITRLRTRLAVITGEWDRARVELEQVLQSAEGGTRVWALLQLAEIAETALRDARLARQHKIEALRCAAASEAALDELRQRLLVSKESKRALVENAESILASGEFEDVDGLRLVIARILLDDLDEPARAVRHLGQLRPGAAEQASAATLSARALERTGSRAEALKQYHRLLRRDSRCGEAYRGIARLAEAPVAAAAASLVEVLGGELDEAGAAELQRMRNLAGPSGTFLPSFLERQDVERRLEGIVRLLKPALISTYGQQGGDAVAPAHPAAVAVSRLCNAFGIAAVGVEIAGRDGATAVFGDPLTVQLAPALAAAYSGPAFRAAVARLLALGPVGTLFYRLNQDQADELFDALIRKRPLLAGGQRLRKTLYNELSRKERKECEQLELETNVELGALRHGWERRAERAALVLSLHPGIALRTLGEAVGKGSGPLFEVPRFAELVQFVLSDEFLQLFRSVWGKAL